MDIIRIATTGGPDSSWTVYLQVCDRCEHWAACEGEPSRPELLLQPHALRNRARAVYNYRHATSRALTMTVVVVVATIVVVASNV